MLILTIIVSGSCEDVSKTTFANRELFINPQNSVKVRKYKMTLEREPELWKYHYEDILDSDRNIDLIYDLKSGQLTFGFTAFRPTTKSEFEILELSSLKFKKYELIEPVVDGTGPILFNKEYGLLGIGNVMGPNLVCLPDKKDGKLAKNISKKLFE
jgi:hypothetical protein